MIVQIIAGAAGIQLAIAVLVGTSGQPALGGVLGFLAGVFGAAALWLAYMEEP